MRNKCCDDYKKLIKKQETLACCQQETYVTQTIIFELKISWEQFRRHVPFDKAILTAHQPILF